MKISKENIEKLAKKYFEEAVRYYNNAKDILEKIKIVYKTYDDSKYVSNACGMCYLGVLKALDGYLILRGMEESELPQSYQGYIYALKRYLAHNGKIKSALTVVYQNLHILGYYRGGVNVEMIKAGFSCAKFIIEHFSRMTK